MVRRVVERIMTMQIEPVERAAIAQLVIDELREEPQLWLPADLLRLPQDVAGLTQDVAALTQTVNALVQTVAALAEGQQAIIAEQRAHGARLDALEEGQRAIIAEQRVLAEGQRAIVAEQRVLAEGQRVIIEEQRDMATLLKRVEDDLGTVKGWGLEVLCARRPGMIANALNMISFRAIDPGEVAAMAANAYNNGAITRDEHNQLILADVIYRGVRHSDRAPCYTLLEASYVVDINDVNRAVERAGILARITGQSTISAVAGDHITVGAQAATSTATATPSGVAGGDGVVYIHVENGARLRS